MRSKWFEYKDQAIALRKSGISIPAIRKKWGIPKSTLSGWFKKVKLTQQQRMLLASNSSSALVKARKRAVLWHNNQKAERILEAKRQASAILSKVDTNSKAITEIALSLLYFGEGGKTSNGTSMGNSDPLILKFFINCLNNLYGIEKTQLKCHLHLRSDQDEKDLIKYWSKELKIPKERFGACLVDKRTVKSKTFPYYKGVCVISGVGIAIQRRLIFLSREFCDKIVGEDD